MALKAADKEKLKTIFKLDVENLIAAVTAADEVDLTLPADVEILTKAELETRDNNIRITSKKEGEVEGEKKGKELAGKLIKKKLNLPETIPNDAEKIADAATEMFNKGDAGLKEQIALLTKDKEVLENKVIDTEKKASAAIFDTNLISYFPPDRTKDLADSERLALIKMNLSFEPGDNGTTVVKKDGAILRDAKTQNPILPKDAIAALFTERNWIAKGSGDGGRGGGDNPGAGGAAGIKKASAFQEKFVVENPGVDRNGPEYTAALAKHAKDIPDFDWHS